MPVDNEVLKAKDVQQADRPGRDLGLTGRGPVDSSIDLVHDPDKQSAVDPLEEEKQDIQILMLNSDVTQGELTDSGMDHQKAVVLKSPFLISFMARHPKFIQKQLKIPQKKFH